jgi:hypothetical protein
MKYHGMIFNAEMVRAILEGRKTQTRRMVKPQPPEGSRLWGMPKVWDDKRNLIFWREGDRSNYGNPLPIEVGSIIWVRETFFWDEGSDKTVEQVAYKASTEMPPNVKAMGCRWTPSIHMPRWASRIDLEVTAVRVERVQDISDNDAESEGVDLRRLCGCVEGCATCDDRSPKDVFRDLWQSIYANWDANPFVWVYEFRRVK